MIRSRNEIAGMVHKAARGAGLALGHCDDVAQAAVWLASNRPERIGAVAQALQQHSGQGCAALHGPLAIDALLCGETSVVIAEVAVPDMLDAIVACAGQSRGIHAKVTWNKAQATITPNAAPAPNAVTSGAIDISPDIWRSWETLAARTYVPATEASRIAGAGAGLTDND